MWARVSGPRVFRKRSHSHSRCNFWRTRQTSAILPPLPEVLRGRGDDNAGGGGPVGVETHFSSLPAIAASWRGWRRRRRRRCPPVRRRGWWRRHPPAVAVVVAVVVMGNRPAIHTSSGCGQRSSGECDYGEGRDEFDLVHGMVPFFAWCYVFH